MLLQPPQVGGCMRSNNTALGWTNEGCSSQPLTGFPSAQRAPRRHSPTLQACCDGPAIVVHKA